MNCTRSYSTPAWVGNRPNSSKNTTDEGEIGMAQLSKPVRPRLQVADIGGWLFRGNAKSLALGPAGIAPVDSRCAVRSYRLDLIRRGQPVVLWLTGPTGARLAPGVWMVGYASGDITDDPDDDPAEPRRAQVHVMDMLALPTPLPRADIVNHRATASMEVLRQPFGPNPSYLTPTEQAGLEHLIGGWPG
jgi:hypothetical protein